MPRVLEYILKVTKHCSDGVKNSSEVIVEYYDRDHLCHRRYITTSLMIEQTEHGPLTLVIGTRDK